MLKSFAKSYQACNLKLAPGTNMHERVFDKQSVVLVEDIFFGQQMYFTALPTCFFAF